MVFPQRFLFSMGLAGVMVALIAAGIALLVLPAVLALLGRRINSGAPGFLKRGSEHADEAITSGFWYRLSNAVMRRPAIVAPDTPEARAELTDYSERLGALPGAAVVTPPAVVGDGTWRIDVYADAPSLDQSTQDLVAAVRDTPAPYPTLVGGG